MIIGNLQNEKIICYQCYAQLCFAQIEFVENISLNLEDEATPLILSWNHAPGDTHYIFYIYIFNLIEYENKTLSNIFIKEEI